MRLQYGLTSYLHHKEKENLLLISQVPIMKKLDLKQAKDRIRMNQSPKIQAVCLEFGN